MPQTHLRTVTLAVPSLSENWMIIGAYDAAYIFRLDDNGTPSDPNDDFWVEHQKLTVSDGTGTQFGRSVSVSTDLAVVGARLDDDLGNRSGSAFIYRRDDFGTPGDLSDDVWTEDNELHASDGGAGDKFGSSVTLFGDRALISSPRDFGGGHLGSVYHFDVAEPDSDSDGYGDPCDNCPARPNPGQEDADGDGKGHVCDIEEKTRLKRFDPLTQ